MIHEERGLPFHLTRWLKSNHQVPLQKRADRACRWIRWLDAIVLCGDKPLWRSEVEKWWQWHETVNKLTVKVYSFMYAHLKCCSGNILIFTQSCSWAAWIKLAPYTSSLSPSLCQVSLWLVKTPAGDRIHRLLQFFLKHEIYIIPKLAIGPCFADLCRT